MGKYVAGLDFKQQMLGEATQEVQRSAQKEVSYKMGKCPLLLHTVTH